MTVPSVLFVFNRPDKVGRVLLALRRQTVCPPKLLVFADGARNLEDEPKVSAVRNLVRAIDWTHVVVKERAGNFGCAQNILQGLDEVFEECDSAVVVEDDVLPAKAFYESMCLLLKRYAGEREAFSVGGYPSIMRDALADYAFDAIVSPRFSCWGWATWRDRWHNFRSEVRERPIPFLRSEEVPSIAGGDVEGFARLVRDQPWNYWDLPILLTCLRKGWLHVHTRSYMTTNIGIDSGMHGNAGPRVCAFLEMHNQVTDRLPNALPPVELRPEVSAAVREYICRNSEKTARDHKTMCSPGSLCRRGFRRLRRAVSRLCHRALGTCPGLGGEGAPRPDPKDYSTVLHTRSPVPGQVEAYFLALNRYVEDGDSGLDVGFGLGYGLNILAIKAGELSGVDVDAKALDYCLNTVMGRNPRVISLDVYDGYVLPFPDERFDIVTCVDVLEHVEDHDRLLAEMLRVSRKGVFISTPNRRSEYTNPDGTPKNYWHLREWSFEELDEILRAHGEVDWNFLNGPFDGPFTISKAPQADTLTLSPFVRKVGRYGCGW